MLPADGGVQEVHEAEALRGHAEDLGAHEGPLGPRSYLKMVPFPSNANHAFTPYTTPSSRPQLGGGTPVFITDIEKLPDGRVSFRIGYEVY